MSIVLPNFRTEKTQARFTKGFFNYLPQNTVDLHTVDVISPTSETILRNSKGHAAPTELVVMLIMKLYIYFFFPQEDFFLFPYS